MDLDDECEDGWLVGWFRIYTSVVLTVGRDLTAPSGFSGAVGR